MNTKANEQKAIQKAGEAAVKQLGIDKKLKQLEKECVPEFIREHGGIVFAVSKAYNENYVVLKWEF